MFFLQSLRTGDTEELTATLWVWTHCKQGRTVKWVGSYEKKAHRQGRVLGLLPAFPAVSPHQRPPDPNSSPSLPLAALPPILQILFLSFPAPPGLNWRAAKVISPDSRFHVVLCQFMTLVGLWLQASANEDGLVHSFISECGIVALPESVTLGSAYGETENNTNKYCNLSCIKVMQLSSRIRCEGRVIVTLAGKATGILWSRRNLIWPKQFHSPGFASCHPSFLLECGQDLRL